MTTAVLAEPAFHWVPPYRETLGPEVAEICELAGFPPDPEQQLALDAIFALTPSGKSAVFDTTVIGPRQNIKTGLFKQCALGWLFVTKQRLIIWSAHEFSTAQESHRDLAELIEGSPELIKRVKAIPRGNGDEGVELLTGQRVKFKARTKTGGRGLSGDKVVLDEAFALQPQHMGSLMPTLSVRPDPQLVYGSSAGLADSEVLRGLRDRGRAGGNARSAYLEWCDDLGGECQTPSCNHHPLTSVGCRMDDVRRWYRANSQLGRRMTLEFVEDERKNLPAEEFGRERLGWWDEDPNETGVFVPGSWESCRDPSMPIAGAPLFGIDVSVDRTTASIGMCGQSEGGPLSLEQWLKVEGESVIKLRGTDWIVPEMARLTAEHGGAAVIDPASPAGSLIDDLKAAGVRVYTVTAREYAQACGWLYDAVKNREVRHLGQPELDLSVRDARLRDLVGGFAWDRRKPLSDITPLVAVTLACWGFRTYGGDISGAVW